MEIQISSCEKRRLWRRQHGSRFFLVATLHSIKLQDCVPSEFEDCEYIPRVTG